VRLFIALDLPDAVVLPAPEPPWRPVRRENQHVTLVFLGSLEEPPALDEAPPAAPLRVEAAITLPPRRPRVLAVRLADPTGAHTAYQARLAARLAAAGVYAPEDRPWLPHVTIGRTRERVRRDSALPAVEPMEFTPPCVTLYRSAGGRYEPLSRRSSGSGTS
jgi:2'-5' RNA ligase